MPLALKIMLQTNGIIFADKNNTQHNLTNNSSNSHHKPSQVMLNLLIRAYFTVHPIKYKNRTYALHRTRAFCEHKIVEND